MHKRLRHPRSNGGTGNNHHHSQDDDLHPPLAFNETLRTTNRKKIEAFLSPLSQKRRETLIKQLGPIALDDPETPERIDRAEELLGMFKKTAGKVLSSDPEHEVIDLGLMREGFFHSMNGTLRDFKFYSDPADKRMRPELVMMRNLLDETHGGGGDAYTANWMLGFETPYPTLPLELKEESEAELTHRFVTRLEGARAVLPNDSVLGKLIRTKGLTKDISELIDVSTPADPKEKENKTFEKIKDLPPEEQRKEKKRLDDKREAALKKFRAVLLKDASAHLRDVPGLATDKLTGGSREKKQSLLVVSRLRALNKVNRDILDLEDDVKKTETKKKIGDVLSDVRAIENIEHRSGAFVEKMMGVDAGSIANPEFHNYLGDIVGKIQNTLDVRAGTFDKEMFKDCRVMTTRKMIALLQGLRANKQCLSWDNTWGESHHTIPELLFSGTADTLVLKDKHRDVQASMSVRLMPADIEGKREPILFRQKARALGKGADIYRYLLNDAVIRYAATSGATKIVMDSGFIGDPDSMYYNRDLFEKGFDITYHDKNGEDVSEHITLSRRRRIKDCHLHFVEPELSPRDGFHAHDDKRDWVKEDVIAGVTAKTFTDPDDKTVARKELHKGYWVVDINRERL